MKLQEHIGANFSSSDAYSTLRPFYLLCFAQWLYKRLIWLILYHMRSHCTTLIWTLATHTVLRQIVASVPHGQSSTLLPSDVDQLRYQTTASICNDLLVSRRCRSGSAMSPVNRHRRLTERSCGVG
ncbi:hypothetical protein M407DRAFT_143444 [Tulasnella calospora MUT 4182]|uniref:Uncharacterized protein n=1 Tax=Tulasnella calospora MUT 4182 TaxID=1051891 RepID=A0A0C3LEJ8_9AGAM|nr:hypothetical protein M407DRAFT_143444 [Tulasnella calospora MUT 4182]